MINSRYAQQISWLKLAFLGLALAVAAVLIGCGGSSDGEPTASQVSPPAAIVSSGPGEISISSTTISGRAGTILLVFVLSPEAQGGPLARLCIVISTDSYPVFETATSEFPEGDDPCGDAGPTAILPEGEYVLDAGIFIPGAQTPEKQIIQTVEVSGNVHVVLDGPDVSR